MQVRKLMRVGNSLAVVIPVEMTRHLKARRGDYFGIALNERDQLVVEVISEMMAAKFRKHETPQK